MGKFVIKAVKSGLKFDLKAANGEVIATSQIYKGDKTCRAGIASVIKNSGVAKLEDQTKEGYEVQTNPKFEVYQDNAGEYRFRLKARNGQIIAIGEGYKKLESCMNGIASVRKNAAEGKIEVAEPEE